MIDRYSSIKGPIMERLKSQLAHWHFASPMTRRIITRGLTWRWDHKPPPLTSSPPPSTCRGNLAPYIRQLLTLGAIIKVPWQPCFTSRVFLVPKSSGGERVIIDLSNLNIFIKSKSFKMLDITKVREAVPQNACFTSIDISNAFYHIPIHPRFQRFLAFTHEGRLYFFKAMPFGIKLGPLIFSKIISEVLIHLHGMQIQASVYIDDWLFWNQSGQTLIHHTRLALDLLCSLGFLINWTKSQLDPLDTITYLGVIWNGPAFSIAPSARNISKIKEEASKLLSDTIISKVDYQRFLGTINFAAPYLQGGLFHLRQVILEAPNFHRTNSHHLSTPLRSLLEWWSLSSNISRPTPLSHQSPQWTLWSDASLGGWGGICSLGHSTWGTWPPSDHGLHINILEAKAVLLCLKSLDPPDGCSILLRTDNTVVVSLINKQGSNKTPALNDILRVILRLCSTKSWYIQAKHIPGHLNTWADSMSRDHTIRSEWSLSPRSFDQLQQSLHMEIDLFAHPGNAKLPLFGCLFQHPLARVTDALTTEWNQWRSIYLFPPLNLIPTCLEKLEKYSGKGVFIAPHLPGSLWWPAFTSRCVELDLEIEVFQLVQGQRRWAHLETSLSFRAYSF